MPWYQSLLELDINRGMVTLGTIALGVAGFVWFTIQNRAFGSGFTDRGGLTYVVGPMGSGKSMFGVRKIAAALVNGEYVVTNVRLLDGWADTLVRWHFWKDARDPARKRARIEWLEGHYIYETALTRAMRYRLPCAMCGGEWDSERGGLPCGHSGPAQEGRGLFVWDEAHNDLNNRDFDGGFHDDRGARAAHKAQLRRLVRWATQLRKLGYRGYLLSQHHENTDAQLRRVCNFIVRLQNQRNAEGGVLARLLPRRLTLFLCFTYPAHLADGKETQNLAVHRERYWLPRERHLYDSWETFHGIDQELEEDAAPIALPRNGRQPVEPGAPAPAGVGSLAA